MEVQIFVPKNSNVASIKKEYPDIYQDGDDTDASYFVGTSADGPDSRFLSYQEAIECCGFVEGAVPGSECVIEGNGTWAMGMIKREDFSRFAVSRQQKAAWKRRSNSYWKAHKRGRLSRRRNSTVPIV